MGMLDYAALQSAINLAENEGLSENQTEAQDIRLGLNDMSIYATQTPADRNSNQASAVYSMSSVVPGLAPEDQAPVVLAKFGTSGDNTGSLDNVWPGEPTRFVPITLETEFNIGIPGNRIKFDSTPDTIVFQRGANWTPQQILGRPEPVQVFNSSNAITFTLEGYFFVNSTREHIEKLRLSDYLIALVTPTKKYFLPTPVKIAIGTWKLIRAIVINASITYEGPWTISQPDPNKEWHGVIHAPYLFKAQLSFIMVSEGNTVKYAEDIIRYGFDGSNYGGPKDDGTTPGDSSDESEAQVTVPQSNNIMDSVSSLPGARSTDGLSVQLPGVVGGEDTPSPQELDPGVGLPYSIAGPATTEDLINQKIKV